MTFIAEDPLIAHNAMFDLGFLNAELERAGRASVSRERMVDTLLIARRKHPGGSNRLDDLCARYAIDNSRRTKHGALLDAELLAEVYVELIGARQAQLVLSQSTATERVAGEPIVSARTPGAAGRAPIGRDARGAPAFRRKPRRECDLARLSQLGLSGGNPAAGCAASTR